MLKRREGISCQSTSSFLPLYVTYMSHRQIVNVRELSESKGADYCSTMLGLYMFTGEDVTSAFKGKGKVGPLKKL